MTESWRKELKMKETAEEKKDYKTVVKYCESIGRLLYENGFCEEAVEQFIEQASISERLKRKLDVAEAYHLISDVYAEACNLQNALIYANKYYNIAREEASVIELQRATTTLGRIYFLMSFEESKEADKNINLQKSLEFYTKSQTLLKSLSGSISKSDIAEMRSCLCLNLANIYEVLNQMSEAEKMYKECATLSQSCNSRDTEIKALLALSSLKVTQYEYNEAYSLAFDCIRCLKKCRDKSLSFQVNINLAKIKILQANFNDSARYLKTCSRNLRLADEQSLNEYNTYARACYECLTAQRLFSIVQNNETKTIYFHKTGLVLFKLKAYKSAIKYFIDELKINENQNSVNVFSIHKMIGDCYLYQNNYKEAAIYYSKCLNEENDKLSIAELYLNYGTCVLNLNSPYSNIIPHFTSALNFASDSNSLKLKIYTAIKNAQEKHKMTKELLKTDELIENLDYVSSNSDVDSDISNFEDKMNNIYNEIKDDDVGPRLESQRKRAKNPENFNRVNEHGETKLHQACIKGDIAQVKFLIENKVAINPRDNCGWLPIHEACNHGYLDIVKLLVENGSYINDRGGVGCRGITPLIDAVDNNHLDIVKYLLDNEANPLIEDDEHRTVLSILHDHVENNKDIDDQKVNEIINMIHGRCQNYPRSVYISPTKPPQYHKNKSAKLEALCNSRIPLFLVASVTAANESDNNNIEALDSDYPVYQKKLPFKKNYDSYSHENFDVIEVESVYSRTSISRRRVTVLSSDDESKSIDFNIPIDYSHSPEHVKIAPTIPANVYPPLHHNTTSTYITINFENKRRISCDISDFVTGLDIIKIVLKALDLHTDLFYDICVIDSACVLILPWVNINYINIYGVFNCYSLSGLSSLKRYLTICRRLSVVSHRSLEHHFEHATWLGSVPMSVFSEKFYIVLYIYLSQQVTKLDLSGLYLDDNILKLISDCIPHFRNLRGIIFRNMGLDFLRLKILFGFLFNEDINFNSYESIEKVDISFNKFETESLKISEFLQCLFLKCKNLHVFYMAYCGVKGLFESDSMLNSVIQDNLKLEKIDISGNNFGFDDIKAFFCNLLPWNTFKSLNVSDLSNEEDLFLSLVSFFKMSKSKVFKLNLSNNNLNQSFMSILSVSSFVGNVVCLDVSNCQIDSSVIFQLNRDVGHMINLKILKMFDNPNLFGSYEQMFEFISICSHCRVLEMIDLSNTFSSDDVLTPSLLTPPVCQSEESVPNDFSKLSCVILGNNCLTMDDLLKFIDLYGLKNFQPFLKGGDCSLNRISNVV